MTVKEKRDAVQGYCANTPCEKCVLRSPIGCDLIIEVADEDALNRALVKINGVNDDIINRPAHYTDGKIETIEFIEDKKLGFCLGNAVKYISRAGKKDPTKTVEDLKKAIWYINRRIKELEEGA